MTDTDNSEPKSLEPVSARPAGESSGSEEPVRQKLMSRRAFLGLVGAGVAAVIVGGGIFMWLSGRRGSAVGTEGFRINSVAAAPEFDEGSWRLTVDGLVQQPLSLTFAELTGLPQVDVVRDFECVERWVVKGVTWTGVRLSELMERAKLDDRVTHLVLHSGDGVYTDSVTRAEALRSDTLLAHRLNGEPLITDMGRPLRLVLPGDYGYKYVKWVVRVEAVALGPSGYQGYWEQLGYPADATI